MGDDPLGEGGPCGGVALSCDREWVPSHLEVLLPNNIVPRGSRQQVLIDFGRMYLSTSPNGTPKVRHHVPAKGQQSVQNSESHYPESNHIMS